MPAAATMIRPATAADAAGVRACAEEAHARFVPLIGRKPAPMVANFTPQISSGEVDVAVCAGGALLGFVVFRTTDGHALLENVAVFPHAAGHGLGRALIAHCGAAVRRLGYAAVHLHTK